MGPIVRLLGSGIGLASEAIAARKAEKANKSPRSTSPAPPAASGSNEERPPPAYAPEATADPASAEFGLIEVDDDEHAKELIEKGQAVPIDRPHFRTREDSDADPNEADNDEAYWELDEESAALEASTSAEEPKGDDAKPDVHKLVRKFLGTHPLPPNQPSIARRLPCPVIIPQRRPRTKGRGFVRAYAPVLTDCGIDQATFLEFLETFHKASQASPVFEVIFIGGHLVGYIPSISAMVAAIIIQLAAGTAIVVQSRHRTNDFLEEINNHFFRPRGLYAMLMTYKPSRHSWSSSPTDISHTITDAVSPAEPANLGNKLKENLKFSAGKTHTELEMPVAAPLIFPAIDAAAEANEQDPEAVAKKENFFKKSGKFVGDYMDRRAQATYQAENPDSSLNVPMENKQFASRYADPNHPASSGSLISLVTGGKVDPRAARNKSRARGPVGYLRQQKPIRKMLRQNVLYLMIVNMPTEEEMAAARAEMEQAELEKKKAKASPKP